MKVDFKNKNLVFSFICIIFMAILLIMPTGFEKQMYVNAESVKAKVLATNESTVYNNGLLKQGSQVCEVELLNGSFKGEVVEAVNFLTGKLEFDKMFQVGDRALVLVEKSNEGELVFVNMLDHYRVNVEWFIILVFMIALLVFSGTTGIRTIISFIFSLLAI